MIHLGRSRKRENFRIPDRIRRKGPDEVTVELLEHIRGQVSFDIPLNVIIGGEAVLRCSCFRLVQIFAEIVERLSFSRFFRDLVEQNQRLQFSANGDPAPGVGCRLGSVLHQKGRIQVDERFRRNCNVGDPGDNFIFSVLFPADVLPRRVLFRSGVVRNVHFVNGRFQARVPDRQFPDPVIGFCPGLRFRIQRHVGQRRGVCRCKIGVLIQQRRNMNRNAGGKKTGRCLVRRILCSLLTGHRDGGERQGQNGHQSQNSQ